MTVNTEKNYPLNLNLIFLVQLKYDDNLWVYLKNSQKNSNFVLKDRLEMLSRIGQAVEEMQKKKLIHLDIKPSNVLLNYDSNNKVSNVNQPISLWNPIDRDNFVLADFGLSGDLSTCSKNAGTPGCASPEQMIGKIHQKSDQYAFGKLAVMLLFDWNVAWSLLAEPKSEQELQAEKIYGTDLQKIIADLLQVNKYMSVRKINLQKISY
jgi:serine/threonine protein kinase